MSHKYAALKHAAERATPGPWRTSYIPPYGSHYVTSPGGKTVVNISEGDVPARDAGFIAAANPATILELLAERDADRARIAELTAERDALREGEMGDAKHSNTRAAADIYFQLVEECEIPAGGSLVEHIDDMRQRIAELEARTLTVKLPQGYVIRAGHPINERERHVMMPKDGGDWLSSFDVELALLKAGISLKIEGE